MSLSDYIKYLRALNGGLTPWEIAEGSGVPAREIHLLEVKHRRVGTNDEMLEKLASYFKVPLGDLTARREAYRKSLTAFLDEAQQGAPVILKMESGDDLEGTVDWYGREAVALVPQGDGDNRPYIVQRGWIANWRRVDSSEWEVKGK